MNPCNDPKGIAIFAVMLKIKICINTYRHLSFDCYHIRNLMGEDLGPLSSKELESLERQLDMSLKQIRSTRVLGPTTLPDYIDFIYNYPPKKIAHQCGFPKFLSYLKKLYGHSNSYPISQLVKVAVPVVNPCISDGSSLTTCHFNKLWI